jgi:dephospho-CoA kinase
MKIIGLSGGIASGKNSVAKIIKELGFQVFDADEIVHDLYLYNQSVIMQLSQEFTEAFDGKIIDRKILSKIILKQPEKIKILESIIHPIIRNFYQKFLQENLEKHEEIVVANIPLLIETNHYKTDKIIAIIASEENRLQRFIKRSLINNNDQKAIEQITKKFLILKDKQISDTERIKKSDYVIYNDGTVLDLENKTRQVIQDIVY